MNWVSIKRPWADVTKVQDDFAALHFALSATGDKTSFTIFSEKTADPLTAEIIFSPDAATLFEGRLQALGAATCSPPTDEASVLYECAWP